LTYPRSLSELLAKWPTEDTQSLETLLPQAYEELRQLAHRHLRHQRPGHTLQTTALVHEAYLRLANQKVLKFENERQFFGLAALMMRQILVDYARKRSTSKRDGGLRMPLDDSLSVLKGKSLELIALDDALKVLARLDAQQSRQEGNDEHNQNFPHGFGWMDRSSTSKINVSFGPMTLPTPLSP